VLGSVGPNFCAGLDLRLLHGGDQDFELDAEIEATAVAIEELPIPVVAAVEGACVGAGLDLAFSCDACVAGTDAFFELPAVRMGILYRPAGLTRLARRLPAFAMSRLAVFGERFDADACLRLGMIASVVGNGQAKEDAVRLAGLTAGTVPGAVQATKAFLRDSHGGRSPDLAKWRKVRAELANAPERADALARRKHAILARGRTGKS
jgi:enoyl-CoA hydratase/carnithine racemase